MSHQLTPLSATAASFPHERGTIPMRALGLASLALLVPVVTALQAPELLGNDEGLVIWLTPILPSFLLAYHRGWGGVAVALVLGMVSLIAAHLAFQVTGASPPGWDTLFGLVVTYLVITNGIGALASVMHQERRKAEQMALIDILSGLHNRRSGSAFLEHAFAAATRGADLSVIIFDLDHFKRINDQFGHAAGDRAIRTFAEVLDANTRRMDLSVRYGGEEFMTVLPGADLDAARAFAERVRVATANINSWGTTVTVSAGVATHEKAMTSPDALMAAADCALYEAKHRGRNRVEAASIGHPPFATTQRPTDMNEERPMNKIMIIEDDPAIRRGLAKALTHSGFDVIEVDGGRQALRLVDQERPAAIVTDINMPDVNGIEVILDVTHRDPPIPVVAISGGGMLAKELLLDNAEALGAVRSLAKPFELNELVEAVQDAIRVPAGC